MVNLILTGRATGGVFDGSKDLERRRVSLINYKGAWGRILGAKLNKNHEKSLSNNYFFNEICKCQKNQKTDVGKNTKIGKTKCRKNVFDQNFDH